MGFEWIVTHNGSGYRCGYVRVPAGHPWHGRGYDDIDVDCHGGLTFAEADEPCTAPGPDDAWWVGFDCAHYTDAPDPFLPGANLPRFPESVFPNGRTVKSQYFTEAECLKICAQAAQAEAQESDAQI